MRSRMDRQDRAKQFMPFAALKGHPEALREEETPYVPQAELSEEAKEELNGVLKQLQPGDFVTVEYYKNNGYREITGTVRKISKEGGYLLVEDTKIPFTRLYVVRDSFLGEF